MSVSKQALALLVAAGYITQERVDNALAIASSIKTPIAASSQSALKNLLDAVKERPDRMGIESVVISDAENALLDPEVPQVVITMEGGTFSHVASNHPVKIMVVDYDTDGVEEGKITDVDQDDGTTAEAYVSIIAGERDVEPEFVNRRFAKFFETDGNEC